LCGRAHSSRNSQTLSPLTRLPRPPSCAQISRPHAGCPAVFRGGEHLLRYWRTNHFDGDAQLAHPNRFADRAAYAVLKAVHRAIGLIRGADGYTPPVVFDALLTALASNNNEHNFVPRAPTSPGPPEKARPPLTAEYAAAQQHAHTC